jgi:hypothetical protein
MRSYAAFNEEVGIRYEEWLVVQHYEPRTKQFYRRIVRTFKYEGGDQINTSLLSVVLHD